MKKITLTYALNEIGFQETDVEGYFILEMDSLKAELIIPTEDCEDQHTFWTVYGEFGEVANGAHEEAYIAAHIAHFSLTLSLSSRRRFIYLPYGKCTS